MFDQVRLRDGTEAWVCPLQSSDRDVFAEEFEKLSPESRRQRFLSPVVQLTDALLEALVDDVDGKDHIALVLFAESGPGTRTFEPVAIGRMVRYPDLPEAADLAVTVKDAWHGRGAATALLPVLVSQRPRGVTHILTEVAADNPASLAMLRRLGPTTVSDTGSGTNDVAVDLTGDPHPQIRPDGERLHPVLTDPSRVRLRQRDGVCAWLE